METEQQHLAEALAGPIADGRVVLEWVAQASWDGVHTRLLTGEWHVLHFVGHGDFDPQTEEGLLGFVGPDGRADWVEASRLADLLSEAQPTPRLVVLNSCSSGETGIDDLFSGTAAALVHSGIHAVAAMQFSVSDTAAIAFARGFYTALASGRAIDEAVRSGRISILGTPGTLEWLTPVLYLRGNATRLFAFAPAPSPPTGPHGGPDPDGSARRRAELRALLVEARAEFRLRNYDSAVALLDDLLTLEPDYPDGTELRHAALAQQRLADGYREAGEAETAGDWQAASALYAEVLTIDPTYRDAADRKQACDTRQRVADLQAELRMHAAAERWQAVIEVDDELRQLDPDAADPDGLTTRARDARDQAQRAAELKRHYCQARAAEDNADWDDAAASYAEILAIDPTYRDAATRRYTCITRQRVADLQDQIRAQAELEHWQAVLDLAELLHDQGPAAADPDGLTTRARRAVQEAQRADELEHRYTQARAAEDHGQWVDAAADYAEILQSDPGYRDAADRKQACETRQQVAALQDQLRVHAAAEHWQAVLEVDDKLGQLDPAAADPDGLTTRARRAVQEAQRADELQRQYTRARAAQHKGQWADAAAAYAEILAADPTYRDAATRKDACEGEAAREVLTVSRGLARTTTPPSAEQESTRAALSTHVPATSQQPGEAALETSAPDVVDRALQTPTIVDKYPRSTSIAESDPARGRAKRRRFWLITIGVAFILILGVVVVTRGSGGPGQEAPVRTLTGHTDYVRAVAVTPDGRQIVSGSSDNTVRVWDLATGTLVRTLTGHTDGVTDGVEAVAVTPDGRQIVSGARDNTMRVWDLATGTLVRTLTGHTSTVWAVAVTPDGRQIVSGSWDNTVRVWDLATGTLVRTLAGHTDWVGAVAVTPNGQQIVGGSGNTVYVWDLATGTLVRTLTGHTDTVGAVAVTPDGRQIVSGSGDETVRVWDLTTGALVRTLTGQPHAGVNTALGRSGAVRAVAVTPDGRRIVSGFQNGEGGVWDLATGALVRTLTGHAWGRAINAVAVTPDGRQIVGGSDDRTVSVWNMPT